MFDDGVFDDLKGGADVLHHGGGDAGQEVGLARGDHGVELLTQIRSTQGRRRHDARMEVEDRCLGTFTVYVRVCTDGNSGVGRLYFRSIQTCCGEVGRAGREHTGSGVSSPCPASQGIPIYICKRIWGFDTSDE